MIRGFGDVGVEVPGLNINTFSYTFFYFSVTVLLEHCNQAYFTYMFGLYFISPYLVLSVLLNRKRFVLCTMISLSVYRFLVVSISSYSASVTKDCTCKFHITLLPFYQSVHNPNWKL